ncbi:MAG: flippase-like domain-containing protein [Chloroflexi bacterium]|nr:flippase-like domain-containing protein [Chloroflexota bacterium]
MDINIPAPAVKRIERKHIFYLALFAIGFFVLLPHLIGFQRAWAIIQRADAGLLALALAAEALRYAASAGSTIILARLFGRRVPFIPMTEAFFATGALNRSFSTGGAPGIILRLLFLTRQGIPGGGVAAIYLIENIAGFIVGGLLFLAGVAALGGAQTLNGFAGDVALTVLIGAGLFALVFIVAKRDRSWLERTVLSLAMLLDLVVRRFLGRGFFRLRQVRQGLLDFYTGLEWARARPRYVAGSLAMNILRSLAGFASLYLAFLALGSSAALPALILFYTTGSLLSTVSAMPGEMFLVGAGLAIFSLSFGIPRDLALVAILLSRTITFWLPLPLGYLALWNLRRRKYI